MSSAASSAAWWWLPDKSDCYVAGRELSRTVKGELVCVTSDGRTMVPVAADECFRIASLESLQHEPPVDLVKLEEVNPPTILHALRCRFSNRQIYTALGNILIALNPFELLEEVYTPELLLKYQAKYSDAAAPDAGLQPHVYDISARAMSRLYSAFGAPSGAARPAGESASSFPGFDQGLVVSGESGAGKTETTKRALEYLTRIVGSESGVEQRILSASPLLEAIGNAKTLRNNNSSRFGKWMEVYISPPPNGAIVACRNVTYLLEKGRVVYQDAGERNYHLTYALAMGAPAALRASLELPDDAASLGYLRSDDGDARLGEAARGWWCEVDRAIAEVGFGDGERADLVRIVAAVLHLGNVALGPSADEEGSVIARGAAGAEPCARCARVLDCDRGALEQAMTYRSLSTGGRGSGRTGSVTRVPLKVDDAVVARDALARQVYNALFEWTVARINAAVAGAGADASARGDGRLLEDCRFIGILDIFGFEVRI